MAIPMTADFEIEKIKLGTSPIILVELQTAGQFFASREPEFVGNWTAGDGLIAGSGIVAGDPYPTFDTFLTRLDQGGVGDIAQTWEPQSGLALTGSTSIQILNQGLFSHVTDDIDFTNLKIRIRLGFYGQTWQDYIPIFQGAIEDFDATYLQFVLRCIDDTLVTLKPLPPQTGSDYLPRSATVGRAIPIVLGDVDLLPAIPLLTDTVGTLFLPIGSGDTELYVFPVTAPFPPTGEILIDSETIQYASVYPGVIAQQQVLIFNDLTRLAGAAHNAGVDVTLTNITYEYLLGFEGQDVRRIRLSDGSDPTTAVSVVSRPLDPYGNDPRRIHVLLSETGGEDLTATMGGENRAENLLVNGDGDGDPTTVGWTVTAGSWASVVLGVENAIRGRVNVAQAIDSELVQDVPTTIGGLYRFTGTITLDSTNPPPFATIQIGSVASPAAIFDFGQITNQFDTGVDLTFRAISSTTRITLKVDTSTPATAEDAYFDHMVLYEVESENPSSQIEWLINTHMRNIRVDRTSFDDAYERYEEWGDRLAGTLDTTQEAQNLLGRLAYQYRAKTFFNERGDQKWVIFDNARNPITSITANDVDKGTFHVMLEPEEKIRTQFYVYFNRRADVSNGSLGGRESYQNVLYATPEDTNSVEDAILSFLCQQARDYLRVDRVMEIFADMIPDAATADRLLSHVVRENTYRRYLAMFTTWINNVELEIGDFVRIGHDLLPDSCNGKLFEVQNKVIHPNGMKVSYKCAFVDQTQYSGYIERWEPIRNGVPSEIHTESWEPAPPPFVAFIGAGGEIIRNNPWIELWEPSTVARGERFEEYDSLDDLGRTPVELTTSLVQTHLPTITNYLNVADDPGVEYITTLGYNLPISDHQLQPRMLLSGSVDYQRTEIDGIAAPAYGFRKPLLLPTGGPGSNPALQFLRNGTNTAKYFVRQGVRSSWGLDWTLHDFTINFWMYQSEKGTNHRPYLMLGNYSSVLTPDDEFPFFFWWNKDTDRYNMVLDYYDESGASTVAFNDMIDMMEAHANYTVQTTLGAPSLNTWYMHTIRWDLSTLTMDWKINDGTAVTKTISSPTTSWNDSTGLRWMAMYRNYQTNIVPDGFGMNGRWAQPSFWGRYLTNSEVTELYNGGSSLPYPFL